MGQAKKVLLKALRIFGVVFGVTFFVATVIYSKSTQVDVGLTLLPTWVVMYIFPLVFGVVISTGYTMYSEGFSLFSSSPKKLFNELNRLEYLMARYKLTDEVKGSMQQIRNFILEQIQ